MPDARDATAVADVAALRDGVGAIEIARDAVRVAGPDASTFLQGQLSQDVERLPAGGHAWSWLLAPTGKVDALVRVSRLSPDELVLDTDPGHGDVVATRLRRFLLRTKAEIDRLDDWTWVTVRGPAAARSEGDPLPGLPGHDLVGPAATVEPPAGARRCDPASWEQVRIRAGFPRMGAELGPDVIPGEAGQWLIDAAVSFTKGCYTGQELVARVDSRGGNVPRRLRVVELDGGPAPPVGGSLLAPGGRAVGALTSVAADATGPGTWVALAFVHRSVDVPATLALGDRSARVLPVAAP